MHAATWRGAGSPASPIHTSRLTLLDATPAMIRADKNGSVANRQDFAAATGLSIPECWPPEHWDASALDWLLNTMSEHPDAPGWARYIALRTAGTAMLIGSCGCVGPPEATDDVEIGYSVLPPFQRQGYATEATTALIEWIFRFAHVRSVNAQTFPHLAGSLGVLRRCGFTAAGDGAEPGALRFRRMRA